MGRDNIHFAIPVEIARVNASAGHVDHLRRSFAELGNDLGAGQIGIVIRERIIGDQDANQRILAV